MNDQLSRLPREELAALAIGYLDLANAFDYTSLSNGQGCSWKVSANANDRLNDIEQIMDWLTATLAPREGHWRKRFADLTESLKTPVRCQECGEEFLREVTYQVTCLDCPSPFG